MTAVEGVPAPVLTVSLVKCCQARRRQEESTAGLRASGRRHRVWLRGGARLNTDKALGSGPSSTGIVSWAWT